MTSAPLELSSKATTATEEPGGAPPGLRQRVFDDTVNLGEDEAASRWDWPPKDRSNHRETRAAPPSFMTIEMPPSAMLAAPQSSGVTYGPSVARRPNLQERRTATGDPGQSYEMRPLRPEIRRAISSQPMPAAPHGIGMGPERTDFFVESSRDATSLRPLVQLSATVVGRVVLMMSLGGISTGFVHAPPLAPGLTHGGAPDANIDGGNSREINAKILAASAGGVAAGVALVIWGLGSFARDTWELNPRRAAFMGALSVIGVLGVSGGGLTYIYGEDTNNYAARWGACVPRTIGNFCVFYALPNAFATSEIVHGNAPIPNREQTRQLTFAVGGAMMMFWAHISSPGLNAPLWAREMAQALALVGLCVGASLSRTNTVRLEAEGRATARRRSTPGLGSSQPMPWAGNQGNRHLLGSLTPAVEVDEPLYPSPRNSGASMVR